MCAMRLRSIEAGSQGGGEGGYKWEKVCVGVGTVWGVGVGREGSVYSIYTMAGGAVFGMERACLLDVCREVWHNCTRL